MTKQDKIPEGILLGIKARNKKKQYCKHGHLLPPKYNGRRVCKVCVEIRRNNNKDRLSEYQHNKRVNRIKIRDSRFPMIERLKVKGVLA